jgi:hypothetical protein
VATETLQIEILDPAARKTIDDLADRKLISVRSRRAEELDALLRRLRRNADSAPTLEEIQEEVEIVRAERYKKK